MQWAQDYAMLNRELMMQAVHKAIGTELGRPVGVIDQINCHHNYTTRQHHRGRNV